MLKTTDLENMQVIVSGSIQSAINRFYADLREAINMMEASGMVEGAIKQRLIREKKDNGRLFSGLTSKVKESVGQAVNLSANRSMYNKYAEMSGKGQDPGKLKYRWITVSDNPCPDCLPRHNEVETFEYWESVGLPGSGFSVCQGHCKCKLIPESYSTEGLEKPLAIKPEKR